jgi:hypothetical protein
LHAKLPKLPGQRARTRGLLLTNAELLAGELPDALPKVLELLPLLTVYRCKLSTKLPVLPRLLCQLARDILADCRLLAGQRPTLRGEIAILLRSLLVHIRRLLTKLRLADTKLAKSLTRRNLLLCKISVQPRCCLPELRLLRCLLTDGLPDVCQLPRCGLPKLCLLRLKASDLTSGLHAKPRLLCCKLRGLLTKRTLLCCKLPELRTKLPDALTCLHLTLLLLLKRRHRISLRLCVALAK